MSFVFICKTSEISWTYSIDDIIKLINRATSNPYPRRRSSHPRTYRLEKTKITHPRVYIIMALGITGETWITRVQYIHIPCPVFTGLKQALFLLALCYHLCNVSYACAR